MGYDVSVFAPYPFYVGQKIRIENSRRAGDWEVAAVDDKTVTLRCPISNKTFEWTRFCYLVADEKDTVWPRKDD